MFIRKKIPATLILIIAALIVVTGQMNSSYSIDRNDVRITGTSNLHDWEMVVEKVKGNMSAYVKNDRIVDINSLTLSVDVNSIKSGKNNLVKKS